MLLKSVVSGPGIFWSTTSFVVVSVGLTCTLLIGTVGMVLGSIWGLTPSYSVYGGLSPRYRKAWGGVQLPLIGEIWCPIVAESVN